jgi:hypothetical protein
MKILTKSLASLAFAGVVAVPVMTSSVYGAGNTPANSQNQASTTGNNDVQLIASDIATGQSTRKCTYKGNTDLSARAYIEACMKKGTLERIPEAAQKLTLSWIRIYHDNPHMAIGGLGKNKAAVEASIVAYPILNDQNNLRPPADWMK